MAKLQLENLGYTDDLWRNQLKEDLPQFYKVIYAEVHSLTGKVPNQNFPFPNHTIFIFSSTQNPYQNNVPQFDFGANIAHAALDLSNQNHPRFPNELFPFAHSVKKLDLSGNPGIDVPLGFAENCPNMHEFSMCRSQLTIMPQGIFRFVTLTKLDLSHNFLQVIPPHISLLTSLQILLLRNNRLKNIPDEFATLQTLTELDLSNNELDFLPKSVVKLLHLVFLDISYNQVCYLPADIGKLKELKRFLAVHNKLAALPFELVELSSLMELDMRHNKIGELDGLPGQRKKKQKKKQNNFFLFSSSSNPFPFPSPHQIGALPH